MIEIQKLHAKMDEMQKFKPLMLSIRASELEWLSGKEDHDARAQRNRIVHGGNVETDLEVLEFLHSSDDQERWENACVGFEELYGFPATRLQSKLDTVPKEIIGALNRRGTLKRISKWNQFPKEKDDLITSCESIINLWLDATNSTPYLEHKITTEYNEICQKMIEVMKSKEKSKST
ncbi:hypothetical protein BGW36DRAFT_440951 [Talaromyces proteolyticus]|uniref:Uncharacterized protein n=1 Tax=Talaromyces proteolyticus TaxID=1131652 RepID=A0AAD4PV16_9EURO|nr:uncharacterized protein BGW36DRAFT_440951 [Talaromyces proteolyticus]KAH8690101.1 hypothetical protein BGW36DRAFT_440951 [Talaromyces proteolyticus]